MLPSSAFAVASPASTWNAEVEEVNCRCDAPLESVKIDALTPAFLNAVACWLRPLPAAAMAELTAVASVFRVGDTVRFTDTAIARCAAGVGETGAGEIELARSPPAFAALVGGVGQDVGTEVAPAPSPISTELLPVTEIAAEAESLRIHRRIAEVHRRPIRC